MPHLLGATRIVLGLIVAWVQQVPIGHLPAEGCNDEDISGRVRRRCGEWTLRMTREALRPVAVEGDPRADTSKQPRPAVVIKDGQLAVDRRRGRSPGGPMEDPR